MTTTTAPAAPAPTSPTALLLWSLVEAQRIARGVEKTSRNDFHRYNYAGTEAMILEAKDAMAQTGLALIPRGARMFSMSTHVEAGLDGKPREVPQLFLARRWSLVHEGGGVLELEEQVWPVCPEKGRPLDKAVAAADTASLGYLLRNVLMLARVEQGTDLDHASRERDDEPPTKPPAASTAKTQAPAGDKAGELHRLISEQCERLGVESDERRRYVRAEAGVDPDGKASLPITVLEAVLARLLAKPSPA